MARWPSLSLVVCLASAAALDYAAWWIVEKSDKPINIWMAVLALAAVGGAAWVAILPFYNDAQNATKLEELDKLQSTHGRVASTRQRRQRSAYDAA